jgi:hypothetical protein
MIGSPIPIVSSRDPEASSSLLGSRRRDGDGRRRAVVCRDAPQVIEHLVAEVRDGDGVRVEKLKDRLVFVGRRDRRRV